MKSKLAKEENNILIGVVFLFLVLLLIPMLCPWVMISDSFSTSITSILPAIFIGSVLIVDILILLDVPDQRGLVMSTGKRRAFIIISLLGCLLSAFWTFGYLQWTSHGYGSDFFNAISWIVLPLSMVTFLLSIAAAARIRS